MEKVNRIAVVGGDMRSVYASLSLSGYGFQTSLFGFSDDQFFDVIDGADAVLLPVNLRGNVINTKYGSLSLEDIVSSSENAVFFGGKCVHDDIFRGRRAYDLTENDIFAAENAVLTAEGALGIMIDKLPVAIKDATVDILGYGRIGKSLSHMASALGANVYVTARSDAARREAGKTCTAVDFSDDIPMCDCIVNTVPSIVFTAEQLAAVPFNTLVIELASAPGGFEKSFIELKKDKYISAPGLPGKTSPVSAGRIIAKAVYNILKGEKLRC